MEQTNTNTDKQLKELAKRWQEGDNQALGQLLGEVWGYIQTLPKKLYNVHEETCDRYIDRVLGEWPEIISSYRESRAPFLGWLRQVLRRRFLNVQRRDQVLFPSGRDVDRIASSANSEDQRHFPDLAEAALLGHLPEMEARVISLRFPELLSGGRRKLLVQWSACCRREFGTLCRLLDARIREARAEEQRTREAMSHLYVLKLKLQRQQKARCARGSRPDPSLACRLEELEKRRRTIARKGENAVARLSYTEIAYYLELSYPNVATLLYRARKRLQRARAEERAGKRRAV